LKVESKMSTKNSNEPLNRLSARAAVYARYSSDMQSADSADDQIARIQYRLSHGQIRSQKYSGRPIEIPKAWTLKDEAQSGRLAGRGGYETLLKGIREKSFEIIIVDDLSRLTRSLGNLLDLYELLKWYEVELISICDGISSEDASAKTFFTVKGMVNDFSNDIHAERVIRGMEIRILNGFSCGDYPYGYDSTPTKFENAKGRPFPSHYKLSVNEAEAQIIRRIFQMYVLGLGYSRISKALNEDKVPSPGAAYAKAGKVCQWSTRGIQHMIQNEKYIGIWRWKKTKIGINPETKTKAAKDRPSNEWVIHNGKSEIREELRIIDQETWETVQIRLKENMKFPLNERQSAKWGNKANILPEHPFSGLMECGICHGNFALIGGKNGGYYGCTSAYRNGTCSNKRSISSSAIELGFIDVIKEKLLTPECVSFAVKKYNQAARVKTNATPERIKQIHNELSVIESELGNLVQVIIAGSASDTVNLAIKEREQRKIKLTSERNALMKSQNKAPLVSEEIVLEKIEGVQDAILENPLRCYPILRTLFKKKILMNPLEEQEEANGTYTACGSIAYNGILEEVFSKKFTGNKKGAANSLPLVSICPADRVSDDHRFSMYVNGVTKGT
jgi:site-specific DNA recombinase